MTLFFKIILSSKYSMKWIIYDNYILFKWLLLLPRTWLTLNTCFVCSWLQGYVLLCLKQVPCFAFCTKLLNNCSPKFVLFLSRVFNLSISSLVLSIVNILMGECIKIDACYLLLILMYTYITI